jgi:hypothetical protein
MHYYRFPLNKIIATITLIGMAVFYIPSPVFALDLSIRDFFQQKVESSDRFINDINTKADGAVNKVSTAVTFYTKQGFSTVEKLTGLSTQNQLYGYSKNNWLKTIGFGLGLLEGTKDLATGTVSLLAYLDSLPARTVTLAYNVQERPLEYKAKVINGGKTVAAVLQNPQPVLGGVYQWGLNTYSEAQKDPLKKGQLYGEGAVFVGTFLLGGGQVKGAASANKAIKAANSGKLASTGALAYSGTAVGSANTGILAKVAASVKGIDLGALIPDFSRINTGGFGFASPVAAGTGKSAGTVTMKGTWGTKVTYPSMKMEHINIPGAKGGVSGAAGGTADLTGLSASQAAVNSGSKIEYPLTMSKFKQEWLVKKKLPNRTVADIKKWASETYSNWISALSSKDKSLLISYTKSSENLNNILRGIKKNPTPDEIAEIREITRILESAPALEQDLIVFRGTAKRGLGPVANMPLRNMRGEIITEEGFMSTSIVPLDKFTLDVNLVIKVPKGSTKGAYVRDISAYPKEYEFVIVPGSQIKIKNVLPLSNGYDEELIIIADLLT